MVQLAGENPGWGCDRLQGALANLGYTVSDQTVGNILKRKGIPRAARRSRDTEWADFVNSHAESIVATDFFTAEVLTAGGLLTFYVLFFIHLATRRVRIAGMTEYPDEEWMKQIARNETMVDYGILCGKRYLIHDRDGEFCPAFIGSIKDAGGKPLKRPARSPNLNPVRIVNFLTVRGETGYEYSYVGPIGELESSEKPPERFPKKLLGDPEELIDLFRWIVVNLLFGL